MERGHYLMRDLNYLQSVFFKSTFLLSLIGSTTVFAALGERDAEVRTFAQVHSRVVRTNAAFKVRESIIPGGTVLHEYVNADGIVFAVSWHGPSHVDPTKTLGRYTQEATEAHQEHRRRVIARQAIARVETENIVSERSGHMGDLRGLAYVPALLPAGVTERELHD